jgi:hypothetical protein
VGAQLVASREGFSSMSDDDDDDDDDDDEKNTEELFRSVTCMQRVMSSRVLQQ